MRVIDHFREAARRHPDRVAFTSPGQRLTYAEAVSVVEGIAGALATHGLRPGAPVAVLSPNDARAFLCVLGLMRAEGCWVPVNARNGAAANAEFLHRTGCEWLFYHGAFEEGLADIRAAAPGLRHLVRIDGAGAGAPSLDAFTAGAAPAPELPPDPALVCTIIGTGGTTGAPKGATWTLRTWEALVATTWLAMPCDVPPVHLCVGPMTHAAGVLALMLMPGAPTTVILDRADPGEILRRIAADRVTHLYVPPTVLYLMLGHPEAQRHDYSSLRYLLVTAAPVAPERLREAVAVFGPVVAQCYGQAEAPMVAAFYPPAEIAADAAAGRMDRLASCGRATLLAQVAAMDPDGRVLPDGETGEIVLRSGLVMAGYLGDPAATAEASRNAWHHTGDIGRVDADGYVHIVDRQRDMIITGGFNVYSAEVERVVLSHPAVQECAVIGVPDEKWGEAVKAVIELRPGASVTGAELIALCREALGSVKAPKSVEVWDALPRSPVGKLLKRSVRDTFWAGRTRAI